MAKGESEVSEIQTQLAGIEKARGLSGEVREQVHLHVLELLGPAPQDASEPKNDQPEPQGLILVAADNVRAIIENLQAIQGEIGRL